ncbi:MAG: hypothetical protein WBG86_03675 [Polyangiales bacterium]
MNLLPKTTLRVLPFMPLFALIACGDTTGFGDPVNKEIDPQRDCEEASPVCSRSLDFPDQSELTPTNSSGLRFSNETGGLVIDRVNALPDGDLDGIPDEADDCPLDDGWRLPCDGDASNDGIYRTLFYTPDGAAAASRNVAVTTASDIPAIDLYFLVDASGSMDDEFMALQTDIDTIVSDVQGLFSDTRFGLGLYRQYPVDGLAMPFSQAPYHHVLDLDSDGALFATAVSTLNTVSNMVAESAGSQALYSVATGQGLADFVPSRFCDDPTAVGYPCFRPDVLRVVLNLSDAEMFNGPRPLGPLYLPFDPVRPGVNTLPPVVMENALLGADDAATALDLGDLSGRSLTLMGMSSLLTNQVTTSTIPLTAIAGGCQTMSGPLPGLDTDLNDAVVTFRFDTPPLGLVTASTRNTHWPSANLALFDQLPLDPLTALGCDGSAMMNWGSLDFAPVAAQQYYLVADGRVPAGGSTQPGAFSLSILHGDDPPNPAWATADAPVEWAPTEVALLANQIRVASVVSPRTAMAPSDADPDARAIAAITGALTRLDDPWVGTITSPTGEGLAGQITNTIRQIVEDSGYDIALTATDDPGTPEVESAFFLRAAPEECSENVEEFDFTCDGRTDAGACTNDCACLGCQPGAVTEFEVTLMNDSVPPIDGASQRFDFEIVVRADDAVEIERIPVRVLVPDEASHEFVAIPEMNFYRNSYDSSLTCNTPPERPDWGFLVWEGDTPGGSTIEFQIRAANTMEELAMVVPASVIIPTDTTEEKLDIGQALIDDGFPNGALFIEVTAMLNPSPDVLSTPELTGWSLEYTCFAAE